MCWAGERSRATPPPVASVHLPRRGPAHSWRALPARRGDLGGGGTGPGNGARGKLPGSCSLSLAKVLCCFVRTVNIYIYIYICIAGLVVVAAARREQYLWHLDTIYIYIYKYTNIINIQLVCWTAMLLFVSYTGCKSPSDCYDA